MTIHELINQLGRYPMNTKVFITIDDTASEVLEIDGAFNYEKEKSNGDGTFDCVVIFPKI